MRLRPGWILTFGVLLAASACAGGGGTGPLASPTAPATRSTSGAASSSTAPPSPSTPSPSTPSPSLSDPSTAGSGGSSRLTVVVDDGAGSTTTWTLTCDPVGGDHPEAEQACAAIEQHRTALDPVPGDRMCAQVYGGPERATVTGTWRGQQIVADLARNNACESARWDALVPLVPSGGR